MEVGIMAESSIPKLPKICQVEGCQRESHSKGYCRTHYWRWQKYGTTAKPQRPKGKDHFAFRHGFTRTPLGDIFDSMVQRCTNPNNPSYKDYGGRGITICKEWLEDRGKFFEWAMSHGWGKGLFIDREDNNEGYSPQNCRFVNVFISNINTRLIRANNTSGYRGVVFAKYAKRWRARINKNGKFFNLGYFDTKIEAAKAYDKKAKELGDFTLNFG